YFCSGKNKLMKIFLAFLILFFYCSAFAQNAPKKPSRSGGGQGRNSLQTVKSNKEVAKITDYLIISHQNDTTHVDTTLTIQKDYKFNYLRRDEFGLIPFSNLGQTYNS